MHDKISLLIRNIKLVTGKHDVSNFLMYLFLENNLIPNKHTKCNEKKKHLGFDHEYIVLHLIGTVGSLNPAVTLNDILIANGVLF